MKKLKGFKIGKKLFSITRWVFRKNRNQSGYARLNRADPQSRTLTKLMHWGRRLAGGAKSICSAATKPRSGSGYLPMGREPDVKVPKGHLAVYVGQKGGEFHRVFIPVIYVNHPLFGQLLREAEEEYGFNQQGGITIPCRFSEFEQVQTRIAAAGIGLDLVRFGL